MATHNDYLYFRPFVLMAAIPWRPWFRRGARTGAANVESG